MSGTLWGDLASLAERLDRLAGSTPAELLGTIEGLRRALAVVERRVRKCEAKQEILSEAMAGLETNHWTWTVFFQDSPSTDVLGYLWSANGSKRSDSLYEGSPMQLAPEGVAAVQCSDQSSNGHNGKCRLLSVTIATD